MPATATDERSYKVRLFDRMFDAEQAARDALGRDDMTAHMAAGRAYHEAADEIKSRFGVDPRPTE